MVAHGHPRSAAVRHRRRRPVIDPVLTPTSERGRRRFSSRGAGCQTEPVHESWPCVEHRPSVAAAGATAGQMGGHPSRAYKASIRLINTVQPPVIMATPMPTSRIPPATSIRRE